MLINKKWGSRDEVSNSLAQKKKKKALNLLGSDINKWQVETFMIHNQPQLH